MYVVVVGASGNIGTALLGQLLADQRVRRVGALCRRPPAGPADPRLHWQAVDVSVPESAPVLRQACRGADAVVHLAWVITHSHDEAFQRAVNVEGSRRVFDAAVAAEVPALVYGSSVGAYSPGPKDRRVGEEWPTGGVPSSAYGRQKAEVERLLDGLAGTPVGRVVRLRPGLVFQRAAAREIARYFLGRLVPVRAVRRSLIPVVPRTDRLVVQAVHAADVGTAYHLAVTRPVSGAFNLAAEPELDAEQLGAALGARPVPVPAAALRALAEFSWRLRLQPTAPGWLDLARQVPLMDTTRAQVELGWTPRYSAVDALRELVDGMAERAAGPTPVLSPH